MSVFSPSFARVFKNIPDHFLKYMFINLFAPIQSQTSIFNLVIPKNHANTQVTDPRLTISRPIWPWPSICLSVICIFAYMIQQQNSLRCVRTPSFPNGSMQSQPAMHFAFPIRCIQACTVCFFLSGANGQTCFDSFDLSAIFLLLPVQLDWVCSFLCAGGDRFSFTASHTMSAIGFGASLEGIKCFATADKPRTQNCSTGQLDTT